MNDELIITSPSKKFEEIKKIDENGIEYWEARELMTVLGYSKWSNFENIVIEKAKIACNNSGQSTENHFADVGKMVDLGSGSKRQVKDYRLSRYACYLIAQNGDPLKKELFSTARKAGVSNFGLFNNAGYQGLYNLTVSQIKKKKKIGKDDILDRSGTVELAANLFRITQTDEKIKNEQITGEGKASQTHFAVGRKVRQTIKEIGGTLPENLPPERNVKKIGKTQKSLESISRSK